MRAPACAAILMLAALRAPAQVAANSGARNRTIAEYSSALEQLARSASPSVVQILVRNLAPLKNGDSERVGFVSEQTGTGSGVIVDADGYIVTNAHVVANARRIEVKVLQTDAKDARPHRHVVPAKLVGIDKQVDIAVLKIEGQSYPPLAFVNSDELRQGQLVLAVGSPLGLQNSLTHGVVSATLRQLDAESPMVYIQTDAPINPGNSGGPLLDIAGRIAGINTMIVSESGGNEGIGFAIPSNLVKDVYEKLRRDGRIRRGAIGVIPETITPVLSEALGLARESGVILSDVLPHGSAEAAGIQQGDVVMAIDGKPLAEARDLILAVFQRTPGDELHLEIERGAQRITKTVAVVDRSSEPRQLEELVNYDSALVRRLGILAVTVDEKVTAVLPDLRRLTGVAVAAVPAEYAALNPGLLAGDVIYALNTKRIDTLEELREALRDKKQRDPVVLLVERGGRLMYVTVTLD